MRGRLGGLFLGGLLALGAAWILVHGARPGAPIGPGQAAPDFSLPALDDGSMISLESLRGQIVLLNFWATWCKPCEDEMPAMERLHAALRGQPFELIAISVDDDREDVVSFRDRLGLSFPILLDPGKRVSVVYQSFRYPETYLIDAEGVIQARYIGPRDWDAPEYEARIRRLLEQSAAP